MGYFAFFLVLLPLVAQSQASRELYIVYMGSHSGDLEPDSVDAIHQELLAGVVGSYKHFVNGFAAFLEPQHVSAISEMPGVVSVFRNSAHKLYTTRSWEFLGLEQPSGETLRQSLWEKANYGDDVIIGMLDTGVWPESESFNDRGLGSIPGRWKGTCESGSNFTSANCNRKLIGARYFVKGYEAELGAPLNETSTGDFLSPRDKQGHGTHTSSTAGGSFVAGANIFGFANGTAKGGAPRSRLAVYKVCWPRNCQDADILAAFDAGIQDGVDIFSLSIGSLPPLRDYFADAIAVGSFHAVTRGKLVVCAAGNSGPGAATVSNVAPWIFTVAASSVDRDFSAAAVLGDRSNFTGSSLSEYKLAKKMYPLVFGGDVQLATNALGRLCFSGSLDPKKVKGRIVACMVARKVYPVEQGMAVKDAGGVGLILLNQPTNADDVLEAYPHVLPATLVNSADASSILTYINETRSSASAFIAYPTTLLMAKPAPQMAWFSSQGPNSLTPDILKPDITAPGLNILAAWTQASGPTTSYVLDHRMVKYNVLSGTSMSCPHVAGIVALLRALYPTWSVAAIKSAVMTSATHHDNAMHSIQNGSLDKATPFNYGAGHVNPNAAADPGLVYDASSNDYLSFLCSLHYNRSSLKNLTHNNWTCPKQTPSVVDLNYPSITLSRLSENRTVLRTVTYVGGKNTYEVIVKPPKGIDVEVFPSKLMFSVLGETKEFSVNFGISRKVSKGKWVFGYFTWTDGIHLVRSTIAVNVA